MEIKYSNSIKDLVLFRIHHIRRFPYNLIWLLIPLFIAVTTVDYKDDTLLFNLIHTVLIYLSALIIYVVILALFIGINTLLQLRSSGSRIYMCERVLTLTENTLKSVSSMNTSEINVESLHKLVESRKYIYIYVSNVQAYIIPKKLLSSEDIKEIRSIMESRNVKK